MNWILKTGCSVLAALLVFVAPAVCFANYSMRIDEDNYVKYIERVMYGINQEWSTTNYNYYLKPGTFDVNPEFAKCYQDSIGLARMAGTSSDWVKWKNNLGELRDRKPNTLWGITDIVPYGMSEWLKTVRAADPNAQFTYVVNITSDSYENMADAIEFLTGDGSINYNGGVNWAQVRIRSGVAESADIYVYEIGNETDTTGGGGLTLDEYINRAKKAISVIRSIDRDAKIAVHNYTNAVTENYDYYDQRLLQELGDQIDYLSLHGYYLPDGEDTTGEVRALTQHELRVGRMEEMIRNITGSDRIKIYQSEHACHRYSSDTTAGYEYVFPHTMKGTMQTAEWFLRMMWYPAMEASNYHSTYSSSWCIAYPEDGTIKMSAIGNLLQMMLKYGVGNVCVSQLDEFDLGVPADVAGQVVKNDEGLNVILINKKDTDQTVHFDFNGKYKVKNIAYIQSDNYEADNYIGTHGIDVVWNADEVPQGEFTSYTMEKFSITVITLEKLTQE